MSQTNSAKTAPPKKKAPLPPPGRKVTVAEAVKHSNEKFREDFEKLAKS